MTAEAKTVGDKLNSALKKAEYAAKELKAMGTDAKIAISEDITALKDVIVETNVAHKLIDVKNKVVSATEAGIGKVKECGAKMDDNVHAKPYHYIAGAAVAGLVLGILIGRKN